MKVQPVATQQITSEANSQLRWDNLARIIQVIPNQPIVPRGTLPIFLLA